MAAKKRRGTGETPSGTPSRRPTAKQLAALAPVWPKGVSGNPAGRPPTPTEFREACRRLTPDAVKVVAEILAGKIKARPADRQRAADFLAERGFGRATQALEVSGPEGGPVESVGVHVAGGFDDAERARGILAIMRRSGLAVGDVGPGAPAGPVAAEPVDPAPADGGAGVLPGVRGDE